MTRMVYTKTTLNLNTYGDDTVWDVVLALWAVQLGLGNRVGTIGARFQWLLNLTLVWFPIMR